MKNHTLFPEEAKKKAAEYYRKAAEFAQKSPGFDQELIDRYFSQAKLLESQN
jgi:hypothetical protein